MLAKGILLSMLCKMFGDNSCSVCSGVVLLKNKVVTNLLTLTAIFLNHICSQLTTVVYERVDDATKLAQLEQITTQE